MSQSEIEPPAEVERRHLRVTPREIVALVIAVLLIAFIVDNSHTVKIGFVFFHARVALIWVLLATAFLAVVADRLVLRRAARRSRG